MSDCPCDFKPEIRFDCVTEIIKLLRSGNLDRDATMEIAMHVSCVVGCGAKMMHSGEDDKPVGPFGAAEASAAADKLEALIPQSDALAQGPEQAFPWLSLVQILLPLLLDLLKENK